MLCQLANHDVRGYRESVSTALEYFSHTVSSKARFSLLHCCTLVASAPKESDRLIKLAEEQVRSQRNTKTLNLLGIANYHAGNHEKAMQTFHAALKAEGKAGKVTAFLFLARILHQQQKWDESQKWMKKVEAWAARMTPQNWRHKVRWQIWLSEARRELAIFPPMPKAKR